MSDTMPLASRDTITTMAFGRKVLMLGTDFGQDVLSLAGAAHTLVLFSVPDSEAASEYVVHTGTLGEHLRERGKHTNVVLHTAGWREILPGYLGGQFDMVVLNPGALGEDDAAQLVNLACQFADTVVVIEPSGRTLWDEVTAVTGPNGLTCSGDGAIIVARPVPTEPVVRQD